MVRVAREAAGWLAAVVAVIAGIGLLYLLRHAQPLAFGPRLRGALPLQQLAGGARQPLGRLAAAWLPAGLAAGIVLAHLSRLRTWVRIGLLALLATALLVASGAASDAIAISDPVGPHLLPQLSRDGIWLAVALLSAGSLAVSALRRR
jgi:hypothetical protein